RVRNKRLSPCTPTLTRRRLVRISHHTGKIMDPSKYFVVRQVVFVEEQGALAAIYPGIAAYISPLCHRCGGILPRSAVICGGPKGGPEFQAFQNIIFRKHIALKPIG